MYLAVSIGDTTLEYQDDTEFAAAQAINIFNVLIGQTCVAFEAALHIGEEPTTKGLS